VRGFAREVKHTAAARKREEGNDMMKYSFMAQCAGTMRGAGDGEFDSPSEACVKAKEMADRKGARIDVRSYREFASDEEAQAFALAQGDNWIVYPQPDGSMVVMFSALIEPEKLSRDYSEVTD